MKRQSENGIVMLVRFAKMLLTSIMRKYSWRGKTEEAEILKHPEHLLLLSVNSLGSFKSSLSTLIEII